MESRVVQRYRASSKPQAANKKLRRSPMKKKEVRTAAKRHRKSVNIAGGKAQRNARRRRKAEMRRSTGRRS
jgi:hypothetical protein